MSDPLAALTRFIRWVMRDVTYHQCFVARVERGNPDGTVDLLSEESALQGLSLQSITVRLGLPEASATPEQGARCLVAFEAGDPRSPYVAAWEDSAQGVVRMGGDRPVARMSDIVEIELPPAITVTGTIQGTITIPGTPPVIVPLPPTPVQGGVVVVTPPPSASVQTGNPQLLA